MLNEFTSAEVRRLLGLLDAELERRGIAASLYVVGGAAIALTHDASRRTQDVDAAMVPQDDILAAARSVAESQGLPPSWLNANAAAWLPPIADETLSTPTTPGLRIEIANPETLLAMKLIASRNRDIADIKLLAETLAISDPKDLADIVRDRYGADQLELVHGGYADMLTWCTALARRFWP